MLAGKSNVPSRHALCAIRLLGVLEAWDYVQVSPT